MVPLEERIGYLARVSENAKLSAFNDFLSGKVYITASGQNSNESEGIFYGLIDAILSNNKLNFESYYNKKNKSKPSKGSPAPFVNDDFLIFSLISGIVKFNLDKTWIKDIVSIRNRNSITITFENILNENYYSTSNLPEIVFMFLSINGQSLMTNDFVGFTYTRITGNVKLFENRSDFQILCSLKAYDTIFLLKDVPDKKEVDLLKKFNANFINRIKYISWIVQAMLFGLLVYAILKLPNYSPESIKFIDKYNYAFTIFGALGLSFLGNVIPVIRNTSQKIIMQLFGYPKEMLNDLKISNNS